MHTMRIVGALCLRTWRKTARRPAPLAFAFLQPVIWMLLFGSLFQHYDVDVNEKGGDYLDYLVAGVCAMTVLFGASQSGIGLLRDLQTGFLVRMLRSATTPMAVIGGRLLADVLRLQAQAMAIAMLGVAIGADLSVSAGGVVVTLAALSSFAVAVCGLSYFVAIETNSQESMATCVHVISMPLLFTSSALVPTRQMPGWLAMLSHFNPLTAAVDVTRDALLFDSYASVVPNLTLLAGLAAIALLLTASAVRRARPDA